MKNFILTSVLLFFILVTILFHPTQHNDHVNTNIPNSVTITKIKSIQAHDFIELKNLRVARMEKESSNGFVRFTFWPDGKLPKNNWFGVQLSNPIFLREIVRIVKKGEPEYNQFEKRWKTQMPQQYISM